MRGKKNQNYTPAVILLQLYISGDRKVKPTQTTQAKRDNLIEFGKHPNLVSSSTSNYICETDEQDFFFFSSQTFCFQSCNGKVSPWSHRSPRMRAEVRQK